MRRSRSRRTVTFKIIARLNSAWQKLSRTCRPELVKSCYGEPHWSQTKRFGVDENLFFPQQTIIFQAKSFSWSRRITTMWRPTKTFKVAQLWTVLERTVRVDHSVMITRHCCCIGAVLTNEFDIGLNEENFDAV